MTALPTGTVTFLLSDVEGSTRLWQDHGEAMGAAIARLDEILRTGIEANRGALLKTKGEGDSAFAVFGRASDAAVAAMVAQEALAAEAWEGQVVPRVRIALHTGEAELRDGDYFGEAVNRAARLREIAHGGQTVLSQATYDQIQDHLVAGAHATDLGIHGLRDLARPEHVFELCRAGEEGLFPPLRSLNALPNNMPSQLTTFIGREGELAKVAERLATARLVTLTGVGGVGKTRLAIQAAAELVDEFPDGVWFVELAPVIDPRLVASTVATALRAPQVAGAEAIETVLRFLASRRALVVLDNCEHVIEATASLVDEVLAAASEVRVLATSREPLDVAGESVWRVPSLAIEAAGSVGGAPLLFADRAGRVRPGFVLDGTTSGAVTAICRRLDGIPLAIELAAARAKVLSVEQIATRLDERFRLLTRGGRGAVPRQQTLQGAIDWSYELLAPAEAELFDSLGVFAGDFDLVAVAEVAGLDEYQALDLVEQLVDKSMVEVDPDRDRYRLLETLRQYAWDRLVSTGRLALFRDAHAQCFVSLAGAQAARMAMPGQQIDALDRLEADYDNLRAALAHLIEERRAEAAARMARRLVGLFNIRHPREGLAWFEQVLSLADDLAAKTRGRLLADTAYAAYCAGNGQAVAYYAPLAVDAAGDAPSPIAHWLLATLNLYTDDDAAAAVAHLRRSVADAVAIQDTTTQAIAAAALPVAHARLGEEAEARRLIPRAVALAEQLGNPTITGAVLQTAAAAMVILGDRTQAAGVYERCLPDADASGPIVACGIRTGYALFVAEPENATRVLLEAITIARHQLPRSYGTYLLLAAARVLAETHARLAAQLLGAYEVARSTGNDLPEFYYVLGALDADAADPMGWRSSLYRRLNAAMERSVLEGELQAGRQLSVDEGLQIAHDALIEVSARDVATPSP